jgi:hypothetical protein
MARENTGVSHFRTVVAGLWKSLVLELFDPYRPERHYMRGPGPKWHAKHAPVHEPRSVAPPYGRVAKVSA